MAVTICTYLPCSVSTLLLVLKGRSHIAIVLVFRGFEWALGRGACVPVIFGSNLLDGAGFGVHWLVFAGPALFTEAIFRFSDLSSGDDR